MIKPVTQKALQAWVGLVRAERALLHKVEQDLAENGFPSLDWYDVLWELERAEEGRLRHRDLHPKLLLAKYNLSRLVDRMAAEGMVRRERCEKDARGAYVAITPKGRVLRRRMWPVYESAVNRHFAGRLACADIDLLNAILPRLYEPGS
jgi:DNA-binding MarR family transcriptional regulator